MSTEHPPDAFISVEKLSNNLDHVEIEKCFTWTARPDQLSTYLETHFEIWVSRLDDYRLQPFPIHQSVMTSNTYPWMFEMQTTFILGNKHNYTIGNFELMYCV